MLYNCRRMWQMALAFSSFDSSPDARLAFEPFGSTRRGRCLRDSSPIACEFGLRLERGEFVLPWRRAASSQPLGECPVLTGSKANTGQARDSPSTRKRIGDATRSTAEVADEPQPEIQHWPPRQIGG